MQLLCIDIRKFPSEFFYQNLLTDSPAIQQEIAEGGRRRSGIVTAQALEDLRIPPLAFIHLSDCAETKTSNNSYANDGEIDCIEKLLRRIFDRLKTAGLSIAVIAPYKAQVRRLQHRLRSYLTVAPSSTDDPNHTTMQLEINTIDGFQGREKDVILFSTVRSNTIKSHHQHHGGNAVGKIGFVADERRLNVAITRARKAMLIIGNQETLRSDATWNSLIDSLQARNAVYSPRYFL